MITEHAKTYRNKLFIDDLEYLVMKAHRLGKNGHQIMRVYQEEDTDGYHVYFDVIRKEFHE